MTSRRSLLQGLTALPLASVPAIAVAVTQSPDAELIELGRQFDAAWAESTKASIRSDELATLAEETSPPMPDVLRYTMRDWAAFGGAAYGGVTTTEVVVVIKQKLAQGSLKGPCVARAEEIVAAYEQWDAACDQHYHDVGASAADAYSDQCWERESEIVKRIEECRPTTFAGLAVKLRVAIQRQDDEIRAGVLEDLVALATGKAG